MTQHTFALTEARKGLFQYFTKHPHTHEAESQNAIRENYMTIKTFDKKKKSCISTVDTLSQHVLLSPSQYTNKRLSGYEDNVGYKLDYINDNAGTHQSKQ